MTYACLEARREAGIEYLTLNRPDVRNALNAQAIVELADWASSMSQSARREGIRAAVLSGSGPVFCAGADANWLASMIDFTEAENIRDAKAMAGMFAALDEIPIPLVCRIQGAALGGGAGLAAVSDIVVAEDQAVFGFTEVKLGIVPGTISPFVVAKIGRTNARELFLTGARFSAARAREIGLVHAVVPRDGLDAHVSDYIREISTSSPAAVTATKALIRQVWGRPAREAVETTSTAIANSRVSPEGQEGLRAFLEKRKPSWMGPGP
jgi:methylglutaconyl-CoA hydratase